MSADGSGMFFHSRFDEIKISTAATVSEAKKIRGQDS
jgi:hypothetical protein